MAQCIVDALEVVEADAQRCDHFPAAAHCGQQLIGVRIEARAVGEAGQRIMVGHVGHLRLGFLSFGDIYGREQHGRCALVHDIAGIDGDIDGGAIALQMIPRAAGQRFVRATVQIVKLSVIAPIVDVIEALLCDLLGRVSIVLQRRLVGGQDSFRRAIEDEHRHGIAFEQQSERSLALLQFGDVDAQADDAAFAGAPLFDQYAASVREPLLMTIGRPVQLGKALCQPFLLAPLGGGIIAAHDTYPQRIGEARADFEQVGAAMINLGVLLVPKDVAPFRIEKDDALRQHFEGFAQAGMRGARFLLGAIEIAHVRVRAPGGRLAVGSQYLRRRTQHEAFAHDVG